MSETEPMSDEQRVALFRAKTILELHGHDELAQALNVVLEAERRAKLGTI